MLDMLHHVLCVLQASERFEHIAVVSSDTRVLERAQEWGAEAQVEERAGHNPALTAAAARERTRGTGALLTISADLPLLQVHDILGMIDRLRYVDVVLAPSQEGTGTNAVFVRPPLVVPYVFGPGSLQRFRLEAEGRTLRSTFHTSIGLALDIDTIDDIDILHSYESSQAREYIAHCS